MKFSLLNRIKLHMFKVRIIQARNIRRLDSGGPGPYQSSVFFQSHRDEVLTNYVYSPAIFILTKNS